MVETDLGRKPSADGVTTRPGWTFDAHGLLTRLADTGRNRPELLPVGQG
jgi:hypothetical protein